MPRYQFETEWDENAEITWWNEGRKKLNAIIRPYNQWQIDGFPQKERPRLLAVIECGIQTFAQRNGGSAWLETLETMKRFVEETTEERDED